MTDHQNTNSATSLPIHAIEIPVISNVKVAEKFLSAFTGHGKVLHQKLEVQSTAQNSQISEPVIKRDAAEVPLTHVGDFATPGEKRLQSVVCVKSASVPTSYPMHIADIKVALNAEMATIPKLAVFKITKVTSAGQGLVLDVLAKQITGSDTAIPLSENFDNAGACWYPPDNGNGTATVLQVDPGINQIRLANFKGTLPQVGRDILLYPPNYIKILLSLWGDDAWAKQAADCLDDLSQPERVESKPLFTPTSFFLRPAQQRALALVTYSSSFLIGPPGTGKTTTLGVTVAEFLVANPGACVLLVSTTNLAVDQALISVDKALERGNETGVRRQLRRIGRGYNRSLYEGRAHLLCQKSAYAESIGDDYNAAAGSPESNCMVEAGGCVRLHAMTIASSIASMASLRALDKFDLIVFDEASQISLAHTLLVMPLGKARLFAGDPEQLSPVARSNNNSVQRWLTRSVFDFMPSKGLSTCFLNEQSRMAGPICAIVSEIFYGSELRVADNALADPNWLKQRKKNMGHIPVNEHVSIQRISSTADRNRKRNGWIRPESAKCAIDLSLSAINEGHASQSDIVIITPYRLQRAFLRYQLELLELPGIKVSTVHSCQGSEAPFVIFDPVRGDDPFLINKVGRQLINVAISRAQAKVILMLSSQDLQNPIFAQMAAIVARINKPIAHVLATSVSSSA